MAAPLEVGGVNETQRDYGKGVSFYTSNDHPSTLMTHMARNRFCRSHMIKAVCNSRSVGQPRPIRRVDT
jgi:hypothetical protein